MHSCSASGLLKCLLIDKKSEIVKGTNSINGTELGVSLFIKKQIDSKLTY